MWVLTSHLRTTYSTVQYLYGTLVLYEYMVVAKQCSHASCMMGASSDLAFLVRLLCIGLVINNVSCADLEVETGMIFPGRI